MLTAEQWSEAISLLIGTAKTYPDKRLPIQDGSTGTIAAYVVVNERPVRPIDMPRALRPKLKLSKRQRVAAKHEKLAARAAT